MERTENLPAEFLVRLRRLEQTYLASEDPMRQSGFGGGADRWRREREPILEAIQQDGDLLDACCANGYLLECLVNWGRERRLELTPFGVDQGRGLIRLARRRMPQFAEHFCVANVWAWLPPRRYRYVYALWDCVPREYLAELVRRLLERYVAQRGRLILGAYGSCSRKEQPFDVEAFLRSTGHRVSGTARGGDSRVAHFAWMDRNATE